MAASVLTDVQPAAFRDVDFNARVVEWNDSRGYRLAVHEYLKRDGAEVEPMGRKPHRVKFSLVYIGPEWRKEWMKLVAAVDENPLGLLIHPMFGRMEAACEGFEGAAVNVENGINVVTVPVSFVENAVDQKVTQNDQGPAAKGQGVTASNENLTTKTSAFSTAQIVTLAAAAFTSASALYSTAAVATVTTGVPDPKLPILLNTAIAQGIALRTALQLDPAAATSPASLIDAVMALEMAIDALGQLDDSLATVRAALVDYTLPATASVYAIAQQRYKKDAAARVPEILANNPGKIPNPAAVTAGTVLKLATV